VQPLGADIARLDFQYRCGGGCGILVLAGVKLLLCLCYPRLQVRGCTLPACVSWLLPFAGSPASSVDAAAVV
jgi:hypothetical protein